MRSVSWSGRGRNSTRTIAAAKRRTGVKRVASKIPPGKRRGQSGGRNFGRRGVRPATRFERFSELVRDGVYTIWPFALVTGFMVSGALLYGLVVGGYVTAAAGSAVGAMHQTLGAAGLSVQEVIVRGRYRTSPDDVMKALGVERGDPILTVDVEAARARLERLDWVESVTVSRLLPDTISVVLVERRPFAIWQRGGRLSLIDRTGRPITDSHLEAFANLPFVVGNGASRHAAELVAILERQPELFARTRALVRVADRRWNMRLESGIDVMLPEVGIEGALEELIALDGENKILSRDIKAVDLRLRDRVTVRLSPEAAAQRDAAIGVLELEKKRKHSAEGDT